MSHGILIFDCHEAIRRPTRAYLENAGFQICGEAEMARRHSQKPKLRALR